MKYFIDTEFVEGTQYKTFLNIKYGETKPTIDLISIGIVSETGREYYAISKDFNLQTAWKNEWVKNNVLKSIWVELMQKDHFNTFNFNLDVSELDSTHMTYKCFKQLIKEYGKSNYQIAEEILNFCSNGYFDNTGLTFKEKKKYPVYDIFIPEFYAYYADYDWVVFCWLFGRMIDLPKGFPWYCKDLKQMLDETAELLTSYELSTLAHDPIVTHNVYSTYDSGVLKCSKTDLLKNALNYPKQDNEHNALDDAKWNQKLYNFIMQLK